MKSVLILCRPVALTPWVFPNLSFYRSDIRDFYQDMKTTTGFGLRILVEGLLIGIGFAKSEEESATVVAIDQAF